MNKIVRCLVRRSDFTVLSVNHHVSGSNCNASSGGAVSGLNFYGTINIASSGLTESYADHLKLITISVTWTNGSVPRTRSSTTYISEYGMQNYVF